LNLSEKEVRYVADLANLRLSDEEVHRMSQDLGHILTHIEQLNELDTKNVEPMAQVLFDADERATLREDVVRATLPNADALANAAASGAGYFKVPRVIER
jgi:aspartyl-tRNA(Asn)/glutamyl-tRNA(Gln) amidotransferase subunit C